MFEGRMKTQTLVIDNDIARQHAINLIMNSTDVDSDDTENQAEENQQPKRRNT